MNRQSTIRKGTALGLFALLPLCSGSALAGPWAEVGDPQTRSDVEVAAAAGLIDNITMQWPLPWTGILGQLTDREQTDGLPDYVRDAAARLRIQGAAQLNLHRAHAAVTIDAATEPSTVRGFDALGRSTALVQVSYEYISDHSAIHIEVGAQKENTSVGIQSQNRGDKQTLMFDGSYFAQRIGPAVVYAGYMTHWWGPGWISSLSLSNNARPIPQIGISRVATTKSKYWLLSWLGPWQLEGFVGVLDGPRTNRDTMYVAMRFAASPIPGLEIGLSRTTEMCGSGHHCSPLADYFTFSNDPSHPNNSNDEGSIDLRYTGMVFSRAFSVYAQFMNEDSNPIVNSSTSRLFGGTVWLPVDGLAGRLTLEYANSIATNDIWGGGINHGAAYNNGIASSNFGYPDGMRYRDRTLGFSLDSDSVLYSAQASVVDSERRTYTLSYHRALVSYPLNNIGNAVSMPPVRFSMVEARVGIPVRWGEYKARIDAAARWQDDQPRPRQGAQASLELALRLGI